MGNLFFFHWQHKGSKKRQSRPKSINSSNIQNHRRPLCYLLLRRVLPTYNLALKIPVSIFLPRQGNASFQTI
jgi:hypothetical protein